VSPRSIFRLWFASVVAAFCASCKTHGGDTPHLGRSGTPDLLGSLSALRSFGGAACAIDQNGAGRLLARRLRPCEEQPSVRVLRGAARPVGWRYEVSGGAFVDASLVEFGGIKLGFEPSDGGFVFRLSIPTGPNAGFRSDLWLDRLDEMAADAVDWRGEPSPGSSTALSAFAFWVELPGVVTECQVLGGLPEGWSSAKGATPNDERTAVLSLPREVFAGDSRTFVWEVRCGPALPRAGGQGVLPIPATER